MKAIDIPGRGPLALRHLILDCNGTVACDGALLPGVAERIARLSAGLDVHLVTADTFGTAGDMARELGCRLSVLEPGRQDEAKLACLRSLGPEQTAAVGNGLNDRLMLREAALGIAVIGREGTSSEALLAADVACLDILDALDLLLHPLRLAATLRL